MNGPVAGSIAVAAVGALLGTSACAVGPKYQRPDTPTPPAFHEALPAGWTDAQPNDGAPRGRWWERLQRSGLDALEDQVSISNQNVLAAEAQFRAARAAVRIARAGQFPTVNMHRHPRRSLERAPRPAPTVILDTD